MAEYYAVERSPEYLMHYGIKGMRWGVRKAIQSGNSKRLSRQYVKAQKKLAKLNAKADISKQKSIADKYAKRAGLGMAVGAGGVGGIFGAGALKKAANYRFNTDITKLMNKKYNGAVPGGKGAIESFISSSPQGQKVLDKYLDSAKKANFLKKASAVVDLAGIAYGGYAGARSLAARHRTTTSGHASAVAKRNEFQREMNKAFAGTKYASKPRHAKKHK